MGFLDLNFSDGAKLRVLALHREVEALLGGLHFEEQALFGVLILVFDRQRAGALDGFSFLEVRAFLGISHLEVDEVFSLLTVAYLVLLPKRQKRDALY